MVERPGEAAELGFTAHPHVLRHAVGFALANNGVDTRALQAYLERLMNLLNRKGIPVLWRI